MNLLLVSVFSWDLSTVAENVIKRAPVKVYTNKNQAENMTEIWCLCLPLNVRKVTASSSLHTGLMLFFTSSVDVPCFTHVIM